MGWDVPKGGGSLGPDCRGERSEEEGGCWREAGVVERASHRESGPLGARPSCAADLLRDLAPPQATDSPPVNLVGEGETDEL